MRKGLQRIYRRGRKAFAITCDDPTKEHLHEWRKQVKYLGQALEVWKAHGADDVQTLLKRAGKLADLLGTDHDLIVFEERLKTLDALDPTRPANFLDLADQRRDVLRKSLKKGRRLFKAKPRSFVRAFARQY